MKLGELFVDLGVNSGNAFNTLSGFAFKFNQLSMMAQSFGSNFDSFFGKTPEYANKLKRLSQATLLSRQTLQAMSFVANKSNTSLDSMVGHIKRLNESMLKFRMGDNSLLAKLSPLGITSEDILSAKSGYELMDKIIRRIQQIPDEQAKMSFLSEFMDIEDYNAFIDLLDNREKYEKRNLALSKEELDNLDKLYEFNKDITQLQEDRYNKFKANSAPLIMKTQKAIEDIKTEFYEAATGADTLGEAISRVAGIAIEKIDELLSHKPSGKEGFWGSLGEGIVNTVGSAVDVVWDTATAVDSLLKEATAIAQLDFDSANKMAGEWWENSRIRKRYTGYVYGDSKVAKKSISGKRSISDADMARNQRIAAAFFRSKGFNESSVRAWVGNLTHESWLDPSQLGDNGASFGIAQWQGKRRTALENYASERGKYADDLLTQLEFLYSEIMKTPSVQAGSLNKLSTESAIKRITDDFEGAGVKAYMSRYSKGMSASTGKLLEGDLASVNNGTYTNTVIINGVSQEMIPETFQKAQDTRPEWLLKQAQYAR